MGGHLYVCGRSEVSWREEFGRKFIFRQICKMTLKKRVQEQKRGKEKNTLFPEILKTTRFLEKTCKQEFQHNKTEPRPRPRPNHPKFRPKYSCDAARPRMVYEYRT